MTQTQGGQVSLIKHLSKHECEFMMHRAKHEPATESEIKEQEDSIAATEKLWEAWKAGKHCREGKQPDGSYVLGGSTSGPSSEGRDGVCYRGEEFSFPGEGFQIVDPAQILIADCFQ